MNFLDALKSGKPFRRPGKNNFGEDRRWYASLDEFMTQSYGEWSFHGFPFEQWFLAEDWEVSIDSN